MAKREESGDIDRKLDELADEWGQVYVAYYPEQDEENCIVRNQTDEGLPVGTDRKEIRRRTITAAVEAAHSQYVA